MVLLELPRKVPHWARATCCCP